jgi:hypothetical protein
LEEKRARYGGSLSKMREIAQDYPEEDTKCTSSYAHAKIRGSFVFVEGRICGRESPVLEKDKGCHRYLRVVYSPLIGACSTPLSLQLRAGSGKKGTKKSRKDREKGPLSFFFRLIGCVLYDDGGEGWRH